MALKMGKRWSYVGLLWWLSGRKYTCQYSRHQFDPWSRMNPHASEKLSPCATAIEPVFYSLDVATVEPMYYKNLSLVSLQPMLQGEGTIMRILRTAATELPPFPTTREKPIHSNESRAQQNNISK